MKYCVSCKQSKLDAAFKPRSNTERPTRICIECWDKRARANRSYNYTLGLQSNGHILRRHGISKEQYLAIVDRQGGKCAICREPPGESILHLDHCHETGVVRGLLCRNCNVGLGMLQDSPEILQKAISYLTEERLDAPRHRNFKVDQKLTS